MLERLGIFLINIFCKRLTVLVLHWSLVLIIVNRPADISNAGSFPTAQQTPSSHLQFSCPFLNYHHFQKKSQPNAPPQVAGVGADCIINTLLFIAGVIPGHIHAFYITCTYFHRKRKARRGRYPGGPKPFIYSERVWNGGVSRQRVQQLWEEKEEEHR
jgi:hypothetical protein